MSLFQDSSRRDFSLRWRLTEVCAEMPVGIRLGILVLGTEVSIEFPRTAKGTVLLLFNRGQAPLE